ncbi:MAG: hypothetical protein ACR2RB_05380 [Gammaproteobacteria bacterium]
MMLHDEGIGSPTEAFFAAAPYHDHEDPLDRVFAYATESENFT